MDTGTDRRPFTISLCSIRPSGSTSLEAETAALIEEFRELSDVAAQLVARGAALRHDWLIAWADDRLEVAVDPADAASLDELTRWVERAALLADPQPARYDASEVATVVIGTPLPGYFVG